MVKALLTIFALLLFVTSSYAACSGSGLAWNCTTETCPTQDEVNACISSISTGSKITFGAGTYTWTGVVTIPADKTIILEGANDTDSCVTGTCIQTATRMIDSLSADTRITGFRFVLLDTTTITDSWIKMLNTGWRVDHNYFDNSASPGISNHDAAVGTYATADNIKPSGLIDNNYFLECRIGAAYSTDRSRADAVWDDDSVIGTADAVYIEDNTIDRTSGNAVDANYAASYVFRYNTVKVVNTMAHALQGANERGTRSWEIYGNYFDGLYDNTGIAYLRGGTGMVFYNSSHAHSEYYANQNKVTFENYRDTQGFGSNPSSGKCDGSSNWDGNTADQTGWPCRDQIGRGKDTGTDSSVIGKSTSSEPAYLWANKETLVARTIPVSVTAYSATHIVADRDYFDYVDDFTGASGVGCGTMTQRNAVNTENIITGAGFWVTDQSCSDVTALTGAVGRSGGRADTTTKLAGTLYRWDGDSWVEYYEPYTYPHPLRVQKFTGNVMIGGAGLFN